tara:strand:- start:6934 stop:7275 length:342 start_codon:yes stop_codon:yes gene_type:complete
MKRHKGAREFTGEEMGNLASGQGGFKIISNATVECGTTAGYEDITYFIALKAIDVDAEVLARVYQGVPGDDLCTNGVFSTGSALTIGNGDIIYGVFDKVTVAASDYIIAYIGK